MAGNSIVHVVEDDDGMRASLAAVLEDAGYEVRAYARAEEFLDRGRVGMSECIVTDVWMAGMDGMALLRVLRELYQDELPLVLITGHGDVAMAVAAMKAGAVDFLEKPFELQTLLAAVAAALRTQTNAVHRLKSSMAAREALQKLTPRETDVLAGLVAGLSNKEIAGKLDLSPRTVEFHRAHIMEKTGARNLADLVRLSMLAGQSSDLGLATETSIS